MSAFEWICQPGVVTFGGGGFIVAVHMLLLDATYLLGFDVEMNVEVLIILSNAFPISRLGDLVVGLGEVVNGLLVEYEDLILFFRLNFE